MLAAFITAMCFMKEYDSWSFYLAGSITVIILIMLCLVQQTNPPRTGHYTMPFVPLLPAFGIFFNYILACGLDGTTWAYFGIF